MAFTYPDFSDLLRQVRLQHGWSQQQLAQKIKTTRITIHRWEKGISMPSQIYWSRLALFLDCPVETFFAARNEKKVAGDDSSTVSNDVLEEERLSLEQQRLTLAEKRLTLHHNHIRYVQDFLETLLPLLNPTASQSLRLRILELLFSQLEQVQQETNEVFVPLSFLQIKQAMEFAQREEVSIVRSQEPSVGNSARKFRTGQPNSLLRDARIHMGLSHQSVAKAIDAPDPRTIGRWERGISFPRPHYRLRLSELFGKSLEELGLILDD